MRKITQLAVEQFFYERTFYFRMGNTIVIKRRGVIGINGMESRMILHGNLIASKERNSDSILIDTCGWFSTTTKERLNGLLDTLGLPKIQQKNFKWYLMGKEWNGKEARINIKTHDWEYN